MLRFEVLGPLSVTAEGRELPIGGPRQRTVLALLLLSADRVVSVDSLIDGLWHDNPPATARTQVAICVSVLRKAFKAEGAGDDVIVTAHPGYRINTQGHQLDLLEYRRLVTDAEAESRAGRTADAAEALGRALALWRGSALAGVTGRQVEDEARHLEESRLSAFEEFARQLLDLGRHLEALPRLAATVREHPLREGSVRLLMLAQYRSGRRAEAMATFRQTRARFVDDLGMDPGPELQELHDAILRDDPSLAAPRPRPGLRPRTEPRPEPGALPGAAAESPQDQAHNQAQDPAQAQDRAPQDRAEAQAQAEAVPASATEPPPAVRAVPFDLPPNVPAFTGREAELALLGPLLDERTDDQPPAVGFVTGVGGVGKTGLAVHWAHANAGHFPDGRLYVDMFGHDRDHEATSAGDVLGRFLRSLGVSDEQVPADLAGRVSLYRTLLGGRRVLVVLDNVRTFAQITPLLPASGGSAVLVTSREPLEQLVQRHGAIRIQLGVLGSEEAEQLLARIISGDRPQAERDQLLRLADLCDRLPLALRIAAARLASKPHWTIRQLVRRLADERRRLDELALGESEIRATFALSYRYLPPDAATLYRRLGALEVPDFAPWVGAALMECDTYEAERLIESMVDAQLLEVAGTDATGQLRYRFQNLLRLFAGELDRQSGSPEQQREARHRALSAWLGVAEQAHRREYGGDFSLLHGTTPRPEQDQDLIDDLIADPLDWYESERLALAAAVEQAAREGMDELAWDLAGSMMVLCETHNYPELWERCCERALAACRAAGNVRGEAAMLSELGSLWVHQVEIDRAESCLLPALEKFEQVGDKHGWGLVMGRLASVDWHRGGLEEARQRLLCAREALHLVGDLSAEAHTINKLAQMAQGLGEAEEGVRHSEEAVRIARKVGRNRGTAQALHRLGRAYLTMGRTAEAEDVLLETVGIVREKQDQMGLCYVLVALAEARLALGRPGPAEADLRQAEETAARLASPVVDGKIQLALAGVKAAQGETAAARDCLQAALAAFNRANSPLLSAQAEDALRELAAAANMHS
jgi:DNA-binding SARP family transcriptional activator/tetratricopeptide (TPR) repeat protein